MKYKSLHKPVKYLLEKADEGNADAQYELGIHPVLSEEDRFFWLLKAKKQDHPLAIQEYERIVQKRSLEQLFLAAANNNVEAQFQLGIHPALDAEQHYNWLNLAISHGHNEARIALMKMDLLLFSKGNEVMLQHTPSSPFVYFH